jgi:hypothetical protein
MNFWRVLAGAVLIGVLGTSLAANWLTPEGYVRQYRDAVNASPSHAHWLGTDEIGRDRLARLLYGTRISLLLAPAAALLSTIMAALIGGLGGYLGGIWVRLAMTVIDLFLSLPWLFLLITARAFLPLNISPFISVLVTFLLLGLLGWTSADEGERGVPRVQVPRVRHLVRPEGAAHASPLRVRATLGVRRHLRSVESAVDDQLAAPLEQVSEAHPTGRALEPVLLVNRYPGHPPAFGRQRIAGAGQLLFLDEELLARGAPILRRDNRWCLHSIALLRGPYVGGHHEY